MMNPGPQYLELWDNIPTALLLLDTEGHIQYFNQAFESQFLESPSFKGLKLAQVFEIYGYPTQEAMLDKIQRLKSGRLRGKRQGYYYDFHFCPARPMAQGSILMGISLPQTSTGGVFSEEAQGKLRLFESVMLNSKDAILVTEAEPSHFPGPRIRYVNPAFTQTTGYQAAEVIGKTPRLLQGPETQATELAKIRRAIQQWQAAEVELINYRKDGTPFWVNFIIVPVKDKTGWFSHWVSVQRDVSERKKQEKQFLQLKQANARAVIEGQELERKRFSRELHDSIGQMLSTLSLHFQAIEQKSEQHRGLPEWLMPALQQAKLLLSNTVQEVKEISKNLMPKILTDYGLPKALRQLQIELMASNSVLIELDIVCQQDRYAEHLEVALFRVAQEALHNALKHAQPTHITLQLSDHHDKLQLLVEDNGPGFWLGDKARQGLGLRNMEERILLLNGNFEIDTQVGRGTCVVAEVPLPKTLKPLIPFPRGQTEGRVAEPFRKRFRFYSNVNLILIYY
ncbi:MAG: PAS domain S-box protein [Microscillaceae bacterium]|nr:PAS domain S-box protein [Microscillaceae bacterium]